MSTPATSVTDPKDIYFLYQADVMFPCNLAFSVLSGTDEEINRVRNYAHTTGTEAQASPKLHDWMTTYNGPLLADTAAAVKAFCDKEAAIPKTFMDSIYARFGMDRQSRYAKLYNRYLNRSTGNER